MVSRFFKISLACLCLFLFSSLTRESWAFFSRDERKIIVFRQDVLPVSQEELLTRLRITPYRNLRLINARAADLSSREVFLLKQDPRVLRIDPDAEVYALPRRDLCDRHPWLPWCPQPSPTPTPTPSPSPSSPPSPTPTPTPSPSPSFSPSPSPTLVPTPSPSPTPSPETQPIPWGILKIDADDAWETSTGEGIKVAVLDTGIDIDHPDLDDNLAGCVNFIKWWQNCNDDNGHGTHVSGIIAAENNDFGVVGVAPKAKIYALKVLDREGSGYLSDIIEALDWAVTNHIQVVNMSLGTTAEVASFHEAVQRVHQVGITQVAAAGNSGPEKDSVTYPARYPEVVAVAATDLNDDVPSWSSRGSQLDLAAPGKDIYSTYLRGRYKTLSGTSMSAPHVTGTVALRLSLYPTETPSEIESILEADTNSLSITDPTIVGGGLVNALKVVSAP